MKMKLRNWELVKPLVAGRWSTLYTARPRSVSAENADYIIKFVDPSHDQFEIALEMLRRELACSKLVSHPGIISFLDHQLEGSVPFLVSARIEGDSLKMINQKQRHFIPFNEKLMFFRQVCEALRDLHDLQIRHGDLSPGNILVDLSNGVAKLIDLGLSAKVNPFARSENWQAGTMQYMAPECMQVKEPVTTSSDVYSLGQTMLEFFEDQKLLATRGILLANRLGKDLRFLLEQMTVTNPLKRPTIPDVHALVCEFEIRCLERSETRAA